MKTYILNNKEIKVKDEIAEHIEYLEMQLKIKDTNIKALKDKVEYMVDNINKELSILNDNLNKI